MFIHRTQIAASLQVSWYIAEFWNTVTNLSMIIPPLWGIYKCLQRGLETRYLVGFLALLLVGIGSTMFHMTLQWVTTINFLLFEHFSQTDAKSTKHNVCSRQCIQTYGNKLASMIGNLIMAFSGIQCSFWMKSPWCGAAVHLSIANTWSLPGENPVCHLRVVFRSGEKCGLVGRVL